MLLATFAALWIGKRLSWLRMPTDRLGRIALAVMLMMTGSSHFWMTERLAEMVPPVFPFPIWIVWLTGALELSAAAGLLFRATYRVTGVFLILFLLAVLPANVYGALQRTELGQSPTYLWFRIPLQFFFIAWTYASTRHRGRAIGDVYRNPDSGTRNHSSVDSKRVPESGFR